MNILWRLLSPMLFSLARRYGGRLPGLDPQRIARSKRRLVTAVLLALGGVALVITSLLVTLVDLAVQYEQRGYLAWNAILWLCLGVFVVGMGGLVGARFALPGVRDFVPFGPREPRSAVKGMRDLPAEPEPRPPRRPEYAH